MDLKTFWLGWRRDIVRVGAFCLAALVGGLALNRGASEARRGVQTLVRHENLDELRGLDFDADTAGPRTVSAPWTYHTRMRAGQTVSVRDLLGSISVEPARGESLEVRAVKSFGVSNPDAVRLVTVPSDDGVMICALWDPNAQCGAEPSRRHHHRTHEEKNDVAVAFIVRLPRGVKIDATTVQGDVRVTGARAPIIAHTVDGAVDVETERGPVDAHTFNGSVRAVMRGFAGPGDVKVATVNGSVAVELPARLDARLDLNTLHGAIESDFPLTTSDKFVHSGSAVVGAGGRTIELHTINGSIKVKKLQ